MSKKYWQDRFIEEEERLNKIAGDEFRRQQLEYERAISRLNKDIEVWYNRIAKNNDVSLAEAKKMLNDKELKEFKWTLDEYIKHGKENGIDKNWNKELENASARVHIERLEAMKLQVRGEIEKLYNGRESGFESYLKNLYKDQYNRTAFQIAKGTGVGTNIYSLNDKLVNTVIKKPWAPDGKNFSDRIWEDKDKLINTLHTEMTQAFIRGDSLEKLADKIAEKMKVSKANASRLVYTESAAYSSRARLKSYQDLGVEKYEIVATLDNRTSDICQDMDGKVFDLKDYEVGVTANPFHVRCRTTTAPYFDDMDGERAARNETTGETEYVPADITYKDWKEKYISKNPFEKTEKSDIIKEIRENSTILKNLELNKVEYKKVGKLNRELEDYEIIMRLAGGDETNGSCSSVALAYAGNRNGIDVLDFRGGNSQMFFSNRKNILDIAQMKGVKSLIVENSNDFRAIKELLDFITEEEKEYYLGVGTHAAIVKRELNKYYYLELQDAFNNGYQILTDGVLKNRFGCQKSHTVYGIKLKPKNVIIEIDSLKDNKEFEEILGYINTNEIDQVKGYDGYAK
jgi:phage head morphogenesis protein, SPP1 gp7 family|nr:MAG TPA: minor capsid protein [Caudoviricetes sp.]DAK15436.1 MAG TPA: minor capsid protein [Caudoviricetes sp.]